MTGPENFLTRWSRRKLDAKEPVPPAAADAAPQKPAVDAEDLEKRSAEDLEQRSATTNETPGAIPAFDPASLPSLDSIGAETDVSVFLKAGVPGDLRLAALRRAWVTDPAIRDFKGLAENDWDFTIPNEAMGFAEIDPGLDLKKMLADVFGEPPRAEPVAADAPREEEPLTQSAEELDVTADRVGLQSSEVSSHDQHFASNTDIVHRSSDTAPHADEGKQGGSPLKQKRRQGGALPE